MIPKHLPLAGSLALAAGVHLGAMVWIGELRPRAPVPPPAKPIAVDLVSAPAPREVAAPAAVPEPDPTPAVAAAPAVPSTPVAPRRAAPRRTPTDATGSATGIVSVRRQATVPPAPQVDSPRPAVSREIVVAQAPAARPAAVPRPLFVAPSLAGMRNPPPQYPRIARRRGQQGLVRLQVEVGVDGRVLDIQIAQSSGFERLDQAARDGVAAWRFVPGRRGDLPVQASLEVPVRFRLTGD